MYAYNAEPPIAIPIYTVLPYCVIVAKLYVPTFFLLLVARLDTCSVDRSCQFKNKRRQVNVTILQIRLWNIGMAQKNKGNKIRMPCTHNTVRHM